VKTRLCENSAQHTSGCNDIGTADLQQLIWRGCPDRHNRINICFTARHKFTEAPLAWRNLAKKTAYSDPAEVRSILSGSWTTGRRRTARLTLVSRSGAQVLAALLSLVFYDSLLQRHKLAYVRLFMRRQVRNTVSPQIGKQCPRFGPAHGKARAWRGNQEPLHRCSLASASYDRIQNTPDYTSRVGQHGTYTNSAPMLINGVQSVSFSGEEMCPRRQKLRNDKKCLSWTDDDDFSILCASTITFI
jgi:hypothetical protein